MSDWRHNGIEKVWLEARNAETVAQPDAALDPCKPR